MPTSELLSQDQVKAETDQRLAALFANYLPVASKIDPLYEQLLQKMEAFIRRPSGGKRMRPYIMYLAYVGRGGDNVAAALDVAAGLELYHSLFLIQDDIIDRDLVRYSGPNISGVYVRELSKYLKDKAETRHFADAVALMASDVSFGVGLSAVIESDFDDAIKLAAMRRINQMVIEVAGGELLDVMAPLLPEAEVGQERLLQVCHYKTASYSFSAPLQIGAILAGSDQVTVSSLDNYAIPLGVAFQITDDILGMFGDEKTLGKPEISDLREGKLTILVDYFMALAGDSARKELLRYLGNSNVTRAQLGKVRQILEDSGARQKTYDLAKSYASSAKSGLDNLDILPAVRQELTRLANLAVERQR